MATTVAEIAAEAFTAVAAEITDAIQSATISYDTQGAYNATTGTYATTTTTLTGRSVVDQVTPARDIFPDYVIGPRDEMVLLEGFTTVPKETWTLTFSGKDHTIMAVQDIVSAGTLFYVIVRRK
ncbi:hypothetical protein BV394_01970 [Brevirhabdus pacifica]|uniref:Uncharacterized protein n=1 Tax=Brevirhabdus pacifica TaxID=1267768 RepID=A0A1U7DFJ2_9RHOB|nr:hypothetical protein [Brevirhabdus pacifica]APX88648.1 hypothetical protein BV394_01970 [Brevirhabdus pacifica]OWU79921.1 hypothetical protein ATO5_02660 [Loktanella sp. 22II-4b]PJJ86851.1 hypothetical protein CLV77_1411 [Brevirhabdus pacifica]